MLAALTAAMALLLATPEARAGKLAGGSGKWVLPRAPFVPHRATPPSLECKIDEDDDGLDDEIEGLLAERFVPTLTFSASGEPARKFGSKFPGGEEPFTAFNVWSDHVEAGKALIHIIYGLLYEKDGGYYDNIPWGGGVDWHNGDSTQIYVQAEITRNPDGSWEAELKYVKAGQQWDRDVSGSDSTETPCYCDMPLVGEIHCEPSEAGALEIKHQVTLKTGPGGLKVEPVTSNAAQCATGAKSCGVLGCDDLPPSKIAFDGKHVELARGQDLVRLAWSDHGELGIAGGITLGGKIFALRSTADRTYVVGKHPLAKTDTVALLANGLTAEGPHDVQAWVESEQSGGYRARRLADGRVEVAWVGAGQ